MRKALLMAAPAIARDKPAPQWDMIEMVTRSWGRELSSWRITPSGTGYWASVNVAPGQAATRAIHSFDDTSGLYGKVRAALTGLPDPAPDANACRNMMTDQPYGVVRFTRAATTIEIAFNAGCQDKAYLPLINRLRAADTLMREFGKTVPVGRTEPAN